MARHEVFFEKNWSRLQQADLFQPTPNPTFGNPEFGAASLRVLIVRLSPFRDVNRSTPHLFLFQAVREALPDAYIDMAFFPPEYDRERLLTAGIPLLIGSQSWRDIRDFDLVLISNAYTLEMINLPYLLIHSEIPVLASRRDATWPPLILGGSNAMAAQALLTPAGDGVVDALFVGEGERQVTALVQELYATRDLPKRERLLRAAAVVSGLWVAGGPEDQQVTKAVCHMPDAKDLLTRYPSLNSEEARTARLQINFGCPAFCSFCFEGYDRKPYREVSVEAITAAARALKRNQGVEAIDVYSFSFNTHAEILTLLLTLNQLFERVNVQSQRVDLLAAMPSLMEGEILADKRSFTLGIEGISARMRTFLHKSLTDEEIASVLVRLLGERIREIKLFYILTGHEDEDDLAEFHDFVLRLKAWRRRYSEGMRVIFSFGLLVRMPFTPLRHDRLYLDEDAWRPLIGAVKSSCETNGFEFRLATPWEEYVTSQVLALGSSWLSEAVIELAAEGYLYDLQLTAGYWAALKNWIDTHHRGWFETFVAEKGPDFPFPLDFVDQAISSDLLYAQYQDALSGVDLGYCLGEVGHPAGVDAPARCLGCGACTEPGERAAILQHAMQHPGTHDMPTLENTMRRKWRQQPVYARFWLPSIVARADPAWLNAFVMRSLLDYAPDLLENLLSAQESLFTVKANAPRYTGLYGEAVVALKAREPTRLLELLGTEGTRPNGLELPYGLRFLGMVERSDFEPGTFERMRLHVTLPADLFPDAGRQLRQYLQEQYVPVNLRGVKDGYRFDIPEKALKKRIIFAGHFQEEAGRFRVELVVSPKFDLIDYLRSFPSPERYREAWVEVRELVL